MGDAGSTSILYSARPSLALDGQEMVNLGEGVLDLCVEETTDGLFRCEATFGNWGASDGGPDFLYFDRGVFDFGRALEVRIGEGDAAADIFDGRITALEGRFPQGRSPELLILAEDRFQDLRMSRRSRTFEDVTDREVMEKTAGHHGLKTEIDIDGPSYRILSQVNQSDLAFLRDRARSIDAELWINGDTFHAQARSRRKTDTVTLTYGIGLREFSVIADIANQRTSLTIGGWEVGAKEPIEIEVHTPSIRPELNGGIAGATVLEEKFGRRPERVVHFVPLSREEAQNLADANYRRISRQFVCGHGVAEGDGRLRVGSHVELQSLGPLFDGEYYVTEVKHVFDLEIGYRTHFRVERPFMGGAS